MLKFCSEKQSERKLLDMSGTSDAVWIVEELLDEILDRLTLRDMETENIERETHERSEKEWIELIDADMKELLGECFIESLDRKAENIISEKMDEQMKEVIVDNKNMNRKDIVTKEEQKLPEYKAMGFNWREVEPIFKG
jgi:hypothetical protein